jgi:predicted DNA-binding transcriptional regulator AlpA
VNETITIEEIAKLLHVTVRTARDKKVTHPDFPKPAWRLSQRNRAWRKSDVLAYLGLTDAPRSLQE